MGSVSNGFSSSTWPASASSAGIFSGVDAKSEVEGGGKARALPTFVESSSSVGPRETSVGVVVER